MGVLVKAYYQLEMFAEAINMQREVVKLGCNYQDEALYLMESQIELIKLELKVPNADLEELTERTSRLAI